MHFMAEGAPRAQCCLYTGASVRLEVFEAVLDHVEASNVSLASQWAHVLHLDHVACRSSPRGPSLWGGANAEAWPQSTNLSFHHILRGIGTEREHELHPDRPSDGVDRTRPVFPLDALQGAAKYSIHSEQ